MSDEIETVNEAYGRLLAELAVEKDRVRRLREALARYGWHLTEYDDKGAIWVCPACRVDKGPDPNFDNPGPCDPERCGFDALLAETAAAPAERSGPVSLRGRDP